MTTLIDMTKQNRQANSPFRADRLRDIRLRRNKTQDDVQRDLGIGNMQLSRYERGVSRPMPDTLVALAEYLEVSTDYLLGLTDTPNARIQESDLDRDELEVLQAYRESNLEALIQKALERRHKQAGDDARQP